MDSLFLFCRLYSKDLLFGWLGEVGSEGFLGDIIARVGWLYYWQHKGFSADM